MRRQPGPGGGRREGLEIGTQFHPEFDQERGNRYSVDDREFIEKNKHVVADLIQQGPSFDTGKVFFDFFLEKI